MPLTAKEVKNAKPGRHSDGKGLYLLVKPSGAASWVLRVQSNALDGGGKLSGEKAKRRDFGLGSLALEPSGADIPIERRKMLTLADAREKARIGRDLAKAGINPPDYWRQMAKGEQAPLLFRQVAEERHLQLKKSWRNGKHRDQWLSTLKAYAFPSIGDMPVEEVDAAAIQKVLMPIWLTKPETARRVRQRIATVLDYAHGKGWRSIEAPNRSVGNLMDDIKQPKGTNYAAMPYNALPAFMAALRAKDMSVGRLALQFTILNASRSGEVRGAVWGEFDLEACEWRIPAERMKGGKLHIVPLVPASVAILEQMRGLFPAKPDDLVFPGAKAAMSDATMAKVLRLTEGGEGFTVHGFRSTFRDWAADTGFADSWAEAALAHSVSGQEGKTAAAYKRTTYFEHRRDKLMPAWAAFALGDRSNVVSLAERRA